MSTWYERDGTWYFDAPTDSGRGVDEFEVPEEVVQAIRADEREKAAQPDAVYDAIAAMSKEGINHLFRRLTFSHRELTFRGGWESACAAARGGEQGE